MEKVLIYIGNSRIEKTKLEQVFRALNIDYGFLDDQDMDKTMSFLLSHTKKECHPSNKEAFMFLDGNDINEIKNLESILKQEAIDIPRKALKTKNNIDWLLGDLMKEVDEEYQYFKLKDDLRELVMNPNKEKLTQDPDYLKLMSMAFSLLEDDRVEKEILEIAIKTIESYKN